MRLLLASNPKRVLADKGGSQLVWLSPQGETPLDLPEDADQERWLLSARVKWGLVPVVGANGEDKPTVSSLPELEPTDVPGRGLCYRIKQQGRGSKALDSQGGEKPTISLEMLKKADFVTLPNMVVGTNCGNCRFQVGGKCTFFDATKGIDLRGQPVTNRQCCAEWDSPGTLREWKGKGLLDKVWKHKALSWLSSGSGADLVAPPEFRGKKPKKVPPGLGAFGTRTEKSWKEIRSLRFKYRNRSLADGPLTAEYALPPQSGVTIEGNPEGSDNLHMGWDGLTNSHLPRVKSSPFLRTKAGVLQGKPCAEHPGATAARSGCIPSEQEGGQQQQAQQTSPPQQNQQAASPEVQAAMEDYKKNGVRAKAFKSWFGDWEDKSQESSKVVDPETGEPLGNYNLPEKASQVRRGDKPIMAYHGTPTGQFHEFRKDKLRKPDNLVLGDGFYFAEDRAYAEQYAHDEHQGPATAPYVFEVYLNIRNPFRFERKDYSREDFEKITGKKVGLFSRINRAMNMKSSTYTGEEVYQALVTSRGGRKAANARLKELGHDGIFTDFINGRPTNVWVAFEPNQIKSVDNQGTFDPNDPHTGKSMKLPMVGISPFVKSHPWLAAHYKKLCGGTDSLGRRFCMDNGKRVPCPPTGTPPPCGSTVAATTGGSVPAASSTFLMGFLNNLQSGNPITAVDIAALPGHLQNLSQTQLVNFRAAIGMVKWPTPIITTKIGFVNSIVAAAQAAVVAGAVPAPATPPAAIPVATPVSPPPPVAIPVPPPPAPVAPAPAPGASSSAAPIVQQFLSGVGSIRMTQYGLGVIASNLLTFTQSELDSMRAAIGCNTPVAGGLHATITDFVDCLNKYQQSKGGAGTYFLTGNTATGYTATLTPPAAPTPAAPPAPASPAISQYMLQLDQQFAGTVPLTQMELGRLAFNLQNGGLSDDETDYLLGKMGCNRSTPGTSRQTLVQNFVTCFNKWQHNYGGTHQLASSASGNVVTVQPVPPPAPPPVPPTPTPARTPRGAAKPLKPLPRPKVAGKADKDAIDDLVEAELKSMGIDPTNTYSQRYNLSSTILSNLSRAGKIKPNVGFTEIQNSLQGLATQLTTKLMDRAIYGNSGSNSVRKPNPVLDDMARPNLTDAEKLAIQKYTGTVYRDINKSLRDGYQIPPRGDQVHKDLDSAMEKIRGKNFPAPVDVIRKMDMPKAALAAYLSTCQAALASGASVAPGQWDSSSTNPAFGHKPHNIKLLIKAKYGLDMKEVSHCPQADEMLLDYKASYKVKAIRQDWQGNWEVEMEQEDYDPNRVAGMNGVLKLTGKKAAAAAGTPRAKKPKPPPTKQFKNPTDSQTVKNILAGTSTYDLHYGSGGGKQDKALNDIMKDCGRADPPKLVDKATFDTLEAQGWTVLYRGVKDATDGTKTAAQITEQYRKGELYNGSGIYGNGIYTASVKALGNHDADRVADSYSGWGSGAKMRMALPPGAKIVSHKKLVAMQDKYIDDIQSQATNGQISYAEYSKLKEIALDIGRFAALNNIDAINATTAGRGKYTSQVGSKGYLVVLNRAILTCEDKDYR